MTRPRNRDIARAAWEDLKYQVRDYFYGGGIAVLLIFSGFGLGFLVGSFVTGYIMCK